MANEERKGVRQILAEAVKTVRGERLLVEANTAVRFWNLVRKISQEENGRQIITAGIRVMAEASGAFISKQGKGPWNIPEAFLRRMMPEVTDKQVEEAATAGN